ncbi:MAG TPA: hypothetical protein VF902_05540 [Coriobacteriia bacterium]
MVGRTRLIRTTGSPLIGGMTKSRGRVVPWLIGGAVALAGVGFGVWYFLVR